MSKKVLFSNRQWSVTDFGLEAIPHSPAPLGQTPSYEIAANRLLETTERGSTTYYDWPVHMAEKTWLDSEAFLEAFLVALILHHGTYSGQVDGPMLQRSLTRSRKEAAEIASQD